MRIVWKHLIEQNLRLLQELAIAQRIQYRAAVLQLFGMLFLLQLQQLEPRLHLLFVFGGKQCVRQGNGHLKRLRLQEREDLLSRLSALGGELLRHGFDVLSVKPTVRERRGSAPPNRITSVAQQGNHQRAVLRVVFRI